MLLGLPASSDDAFLPDRKSDHGHGVSWKHAADLRKVRLAARFIAQVGACDMDAAFLQQLERLRAVAMRQNQLHAGGLQVVRQDGNSGVASGDENSIAKVVGGIEDLDVGAAVFRKLGWR